MRTRYRIGLILPLMFLTLCAGAQTLISTGSSSGMRLYQTNSNDWWLDVSAGRLDFRANGGSAFATMLTSGFVGIGATVPGFPFSVDGGGNSRPVYFKSSHSGNTHIGIENTGGGQLWRLESLATGDFSVNDSANTDRLHVASSGAIGVGTPSPTGLFQVGGGSLTVLSSGNIGVGTTSPASKLHMSSGTLIIDGNAATSFQVGTSSFIINSSGNVGIGTTDNTAGYSGKLTVQTTGTIPPSYIRNGDFSEPVTGSSFQTSFGAATGNTYTSLSAFATGGTTWSNLVLQSGGGNVGIGTTNPLAKLDMTMSSGDGIKINSTAQNSQPLYVLSNNGISSNGPFFDIRGQVPANPALKIVNNATNILWVGAYDGKVGVGTTAPATLFDVNADAQFGSGATKSTFTATPGAGAYALQLSSGVAVASGPIVLGNSGFIQFPDGSIQTTSPASPGAAAWKANGTSIYDNTGNVGIGTSSPGTKLHMSSGVFLVDGTGASVRTTGDLRVGTQSNPNAVAMTAYGNGAAVLDWGNTSPLGRLTYSGSDPIVGSMSGSNLIFGTNGPTEAMRITTSGNVGIGTSSPGTKLHMSSGTFTIDGNAATAFQVGASSFIINSSGNVGIGNANPLEKLYINGNIGFGTDTVIYRNSASGLLQIGAGNGGLGSSNGAYANFYANAGGSPGFMQFFSGTGGASGAPIQFFTDQGGGSVEKMRIASSGNVGIGTSNPGTKLHMSSGTFTIDGNNNAPFSVNNSTFVITSGNVGIGTSSPIDKLHISGAPATYGLAFDNGEGIDWKDSAGTERTLLYWDSSDHVHFRNNALGSGNSILFETQAGAGESMRIDNGGRVGIGTTGPAAMLDVNGSISLRGPNGLGLSPGLMVMVASGSYTNVTTANLGLPSSYSSYYIVGRLQNTNVAAQSVLVRVNGDTGNNYNWSVVDQYATSTQLVGCNPGSFTELTDTTANTNRLASNAWEMVTLRVELPSSSVMMIEGTGSVTSNDIASPASNHLQGSYLGTTHNQLNISMGTVTSCTAMSTTASSLSGTLYVYALQF